MNHSASSDDLKDITDFLASALPYSALGLNEQCSLARQLEIEYIPERANKSVPIDECVYIIRTGAFEIFDSDGQLIDRLGEGECFGVSTQMYDNPEKLKVYAIEDSLVYRLPKKDFIDLLENQKSIQQFFKKLVSYRSKSYGDKISGSKLDVQHTQPVDELMQNKMVYCSIKNTIREAAEIMRENKVSCLLLVEKKMLHGIVTDRDLRNRVVADAMDVNKPITAIATTNPTTISAGSALLEAQLLMSNVGIHHLPIVRNSQPIGVITASDIVRAHSVSMIHFVDRIFREKTALAVAALQKKVPGLLDYWIQADVSPQEIGESFAVISDAFVRKAIALSLEEHGQAPMKFSWLAFGSQARKEQSFASDQDNGLVLEREPTLGEEDYFEKFTASVCALLDSFGYVLCPGGIMASNPKWRKTVPGWSEAFSSWIRTPEPEALLNASIFFDMRIVYGPEHWLDELRIELVGMLEKAELFFMHMSRNALRTKPPLGFFRSFMVNNGGEHENELDIKHQGIALINDLARILALGEGQLQPSTIERYQLTTESLLQQPIKSSLIEAWLLLNELKLENQSAQLKAGQAGSNFINPDQLSPLRRAHLKNAFKAIERAQKALAQHYLRGSSA